MHDSIDESVGSYEQEHFPGSGPARVPAVKLPADKPAALEALETLEARGAVILDLGAITLAPGARPVALVSAGLLCPAGIDREAATGGSPGRVPGFKAQRYIEDRKRIKLMTRSVQLGVSAVAMAFEGPGAEALLAAPPHRRGMYVAASPQAGDETDLVPALQAAMVDGAFDLQRFATEGIPLIHPLWLVRGLSNNVLGFASAIHDLQGTNASFCDEDEGGWTALVEGARAVAEGRADLVVAGGSDALSGAEPVLHQPCGDGAAFVVLVPAEGLVGPRLPLRRDLLDLETAHLGHLGAATYPVALVRRLYREGLL